jgi:hypothetical protein
MKYYREPVEATDHAGFLCVAFPFLEVGEIFSRWRAYLQGTLGINGVSDIQNSNGYQFKDTFGMDGVE